MEERRFLAIAMAERASGANPSREAIECVCEQPIIASIVFGASSRANIAGTRALVAEFWGEDLFPGAAPTRQPA